MNSACLYFCIYLTHLMRLLRWQRLAEGGGAGAGPGVDGSHGRGAGGGDGAGGEGTVVQGVLSRVHTGGLAAHSGWVKERFRQVSHSHRGML